MGAIVISAGVLANLLLTLMLASGTALSNGISHQIFDAGIVVIGSPAVTSPAAKAGILKGDVVKTLNGIDVTNGQLNTISDDSIERFVHNIRLNDGKPVKLGIERNGKPFDITVTPVKNQSGRV